MYPLLFRLACSMNTNLDLTLKDLSIDGCSYCRVFVAISKLMGSLGGGVGRVKILYSADTYVSYPYVAYRRYRQCNNQFSKLSDFFQRYPSFLCNLTGLNHQRLRNHICLLYVLVVMVSVSFHSIRFHATIPTRQPKV